MSIIDQHFDTRDRVSRAARISVVIREFRDPAEFYREKIHGVRDSRCVRPKFNTVRDSPRTRCGIHDRHRAPRYVLTIRAPSRHRGLATGSRQYVPPETCSPRHASPAFSKLHNAIFSFSRICECRSLSLSVLALAPPNSPKSAAQLREVGAARTEDPNSNWRSESPPRSWQRISSLATGDIQNSRKPRAISPVVNNTNALSFPFFRVALGILPTEEERAVFAVKHGAFCGARLPGNVKHSKRQRESSLPLLLLSFDRQLQSSTVSPSSREARLIFARSGLQQLCFRAPRILAFSRLAATGRATRSRARASAHLRETPRDVKAAAEPDDAHATNSDDSLTRAIRLTLPTCRLKRAACCLTPLRPTSASLGRPRPRCAGRPAGATARRVFITCYKRRQADPRERKFAL